MQMCLEAIFLASQFILSNIIPKHRLNTIIKKIKFGFSDSSDQILNMLDRFNISSL